MQKTTTQSQKPNKSLWSEEDKDKLTVALAVTIKGQKQYGETYLVKDIEAFWSLKLENRFTMPQVLWALDKYTDRKSDVPVPADIIQILNPESPKITQAEYVNALKVQEKNNHDRFSVEAQVIEDYNKQNNQERDRVFAEKQEIKALASDNRVKLAISNAVKRIA